MLCYHPFKSFYYYKSKVRYFLLIKARETSHFKIIKVILNIKIIKVIIKNVDFVMPFQSLKCLVVTERNVPKNYV